MRKVKAAPGGYAICDDPDGQYPFLIAFKIVATSPDSNPMVECGGCNITVVERFCLNEADGLAMAVEIDRLRRKYIQSKTNLDRIMAQHRSRSILGQLDPRT